MKLQNFSLSQCTFHGGINRLKVVRVTQWAKIKCSVLHKIKSIWLMFEEWRINHCASTYFWCIKFNLRNFGSKINLISFILQIISILQILYLSPKKVILNKILLSLRNRKFQMFLYDKSTNFFQSFVSNYI